MRKIYYISIILIVLIVSFLGITYSYSYNLEGEVNFKLIGPGTLYIDVDSEYEEYGIQVFVNDIDY